MAHMGERIGTYSFLLEMAVRKSPLRRPVRSWEDDIKMNIQ